MIDTETLKSVARVVRDRTLDAAMLLRHRHVVQLFGAPTLERPISQVATQAQCESRAYREWAKRLRHDPDHPTFRYNRKLWEWVYILTTLDAHRMLGPGRRGVGFGVGKEPLTAVMASMGSRILATDLQFEAAQSAAWISTNQHADSLASLNVDGICDPALFRDRVEYRSMDMNELDPTLADFDFTWSSCSLEHLGSLSAGMAFVENSLRCLKAGGIAVHTTEYNVSSNRETLTSGPTVLFRKRDILSLADHLARAGHDVKVNFNTGAGEFDKYFDIPPYHQHAAHLKLVLGRFITTSIGVTITN